MAAAMAAAPNQSLPKQLAGWAELKAAYRFLDNPKITPDGIQQTHRERVREACASHARVLVVEDGSELDFTRHTCVEGLGLIGDGRGRGLRQHSSLAVTTDCRLLGVLHQLWWKRVRTTPGETRRQRQARPTESDVWARSIQAIGSLGPTTRAIHVMDRGADCYATMHTAHHHNSGFLIRARHDRYINDSTEHLWSYMRKQSICGTRDVAVPARPGRGESSAQPARIARLDVRFAAVSIPPPRNDPRYSEALAAWAVYVVEPDAPAGIQPLEWLLLTSECVSDAASANERVDWYTCRWLIEEWHKVEKTGCELEAAQLKTAAGLERLAAFTAIVAVRILQLRELAQAATEPQAADPNSPSEQPEELQKLVPREWILVVSFLAKCTPEKITPRQFWTTLAKRGGFIGRKSDGQPGWQTIWKGWWEIMLLVQGLEIHQQMLMARTCG